MNETFGLDPGADMSKPNAEIPVQLYELANCPENVSPNPIEGPIVMYVGLWAKEPRTYPSIKVKLLLPRLASCTLAGEVAAGTASDNAAISAGNLDRK